MSWLLFAIALVYGVMSNNYFGWNLIPKSDAEMITDGIALLMTCIAALTTVIERR